MRALEGRQQARSALDDECEWAASSLAADLARSVAGIVCLRRFGLAGCRAAFACGLMLRQFAQAFLFLLLFLFQFLLAFLELVVWFCHGVIPSDGPCCPVGAGCLSRIIRYPCTLIDASGIPAAAAKREMKLWLGFLDFSNHT